MSADRQTAVRVARMALAVILAVLVLAVIEMRMGADRVYRTGPTTEVRR